MLDGEAVVLGLDGIADFNALHSRKHDEEVQFRAKAIEMGYPSLTTGVLIGWELLQRKAHIFVRVEVGHYRPADHPDHIYFINWKTGTGSWEPLFDKKAQATLSGADEGA